MNSKELILTFRTDLEHALSKFESLLKPKYTAKIRFGGEDGLMADTLNRFHPGMQRDMFDAVASLNMALDRYYKRSTGNAYSPLKQGQAVSSTPVEEFISRFNTPNEALRRRESWLREDPQFERVSESRLQEATLSLSPLHEVFIITRLLTNEYKHEKVNMSRIISGVGGWVDENNTIRNPSHSITFETYDRSRKRQDAGDPTEGEPMYRASAPLGDFISTCKNLLLDLDSLASGDPPSPAPKLSESLKIRPMQYFIQKE